MANTKKNIKVRDLKPSKDAKGGGVGRQGASTNTHGLSTHGTNTHGTNTHGTNTKQHLGAHGGGHN
jgi:hypothetical protein